MGNKGFLHSLSRQAQSGMITNKSLSLSILVKSLLHHFFFAKQLPIFIHTVRNVVQDTIPRNLIYKVLEEPSEIKYCLEYNQGNSNSASFLGWESHFRTRKVSFPYSFPFKMRLICQGRGATIKKEEKECLL